MKRGGQARWNNETQRWEDGTPPPAPYTGPPPPRPSFTPSAGGAAAGTPPSGTHATDAPPTDTPPATAAPRTTYPYPHPSAQAGALRDPAHADPYTTDRYTTDPYFTPTPESGVGYASGARRRMGLIAGAAVAVIVAAVGGGYLLWGHGDDPAAARPAARATSSAPSGTATGPSTGAPDSPTPAPTLSDLPDGYRLAHDKKGFTLALPGTWTRSERKTGVFYTAPDDRGLVQIFEITDPEITPREALQQASQGLSGNPGYEEISLQPLGFPGPGIDANQLVYAYDSKRLGTRVKVVDCAFTATDGRQFAVLVLGPEEDWPQQERTQEIALRTFVPHT
ncbi:hypothetical protein SAMN06272775_2671 [Streptomyces sp. 2323.1]|uniref:hypothetical protein n=1 Tax=Streptomyces sp. 2323.1 TaxID=1938841 RepID=UPI000BB7D217|nr:hypothetical protein [Streptomyces sp. 2323.1]SOE11687.1 hypothetical protein SAMN06272775_2671 [Streptomyces sp. 2323.1]